MTLRAKLNLWMRRYWRRYSVPRNSIDAQAYARRELRDPLDLLGYLNFLDHRYRRGNAFRVKLQAMLDKSGPDFSRSLQRAVAVYGRYIQHNQFVHEATMYSGAPRQVRIMNDAGLTPPPKEEPDVAGKTA